MTMMYDIQERINMLKMMWESDDIILDMRKVIREKAAAGYCTKLFFLTTYRSRAKLYDIKDAFELEGFTVHITKDDIFKYVDICIDWRLRRSEVGKIIC